MWGRASQAVGRGEAGAVAVEDTLALSIRELRRRKQSHFIYMPRVRLSLISKERSRKARRLSIKLCPHHRIAFPDETPLAVWLWLPIPFVVTFAIGIHRSLEFAACVGSTIAEYHCNRQSRTRGRLNAHPGMRPNPINVKSTCEAIVTSEIERQRGPRFGCCRGVAGIATSWIAVWPTSSYEQQQAAS